MFDRQKKQQDKNQNSIFLRIASGGNDSIQKAQALLQQNGIPKGTNRLDVALKLSKLAAKNTDDVLPSLILMHPDKELFDEYYEALIEERVKAAVEQEQKASAEALKRKDEEIQRLTQYGRYSQDCGCGHSNDDGPSSSSQRAIDGTTLAIAATTMCIFALGVIALKK